MVSFLLQVPLHPHTSTPTLLPPSHPLNLGGTSSLCPRSPSLFSSSQGPVSEIAFSPAPPLCFHCHCYSEAIVNFLGLLPQPSPRSPTIGCPVFTLNFQSELSEIPSCHVISLSNNHSWLHPLGPYFPHFRHPHATCATVLSPCTTYPVVYLIFVP